MPTSLFKGHKPVIHIILIILLGFNVYANSLNGQFIWDDSAFIKNNTYIRDWSKIIPVFTQDSGRGASTVLNFYRPLQVFTYMIDYSIWGLNVFGYHLSNVILHILVALAVYWLIWGLFRHSGLAFFTSILFVTCPVHTEAVAYISGRGDLLAALFILLCLIFYIKNMHSLSVRAYILMLLSCILAFLSKESALIIPVFLLLYHYVFRQKIKWQIFMPVLIISSAYLLLRFITLRSFFFGPEMVIRRIPGFFVAISHYFKILLLPINLHMEYGNNFFKITDPQAILGAIICFTLLIFAFRRKTGNQKVSLAIFWFFTALLPVTSIYPVHSFYMAEHWLYLPSLGFFLIFGWLLTLIYEKKDCRIIAIALLASILSLYSYLTVKQNNYWRTELDFYRRTLRYSPNSAIVHNNLGNVYLDMGNKLQAIEEYLQAVNSNPKFALAYYNLGNAYYDLGEKSKSIEMTKKAIELDPVYAQAYNNLASGYAEMGNIDEAIRLWEKLTKFNPDFAVAHFNLCVYYFKRKQYDLAVLHCNKVIQLGNTVDPKFLRELEPFRKR